LGAPASPRMHRPVRQVATAENKMTIAVDVVGLVRQEQSRGASRAQRKTAWRDEPPSR
jgi:hypothetical protein